MTESRALARVLVVEDDVAIRRGLVDALGFHGYAITECGDGESAVKLALENSPDLVLLDCMLPRGSGLEALRRIREARPTMPVILVTALGSEDDRVSGLSLGADDYIVKPFSLRELLARVEAVLRRSPARPGDVRSLSDGAVTIDLERRVLIAHDGEQPISERDVGVMRFLASNSSRAVDRKELLQCVWGLDPKGLETRTVDMQIARLRERIAAAGARGEWIGTSRGKGYRLGAGVTVSA
ncbi:MAG: response regulator transcription factor [Phycisphaerae bacterium]|jgi:DNA-binding response OmpR family regulator|nr:response regulator transcription factor [Phycisphaerae bacterium]